MTHTPRTRQAGMTLPELMIGMMLGLLILLGLTSLFVQTKRSFKQDELIARMQEDARFAMSELRHDIGMAGFWANLLDGSVIVEKGAVTGYDGLYAYDTPLTIVDNAAGGETMLDQPLDGLVPGTDAIGIVKLSGVPAATAPTDASGSTTDENVEAAAKELVDEADENDDMVYLQTNGVVAVMSTAGDAPTAAADTTVPAEYTFWRYDPEIYWVRDYAVTAGDGIPTLCRMYLEQGKLKTEAVAQGIEDLQVEYGIDQDGDGYADQYITAPTAAQMLQVISARIYILARSTEGDLNYINDHTYTYSNSQIAPAAPNDNFYRRVFTTTVKVRNFSAYLMLNAIPT